MDTFIVIVLTANVILFVVLISIMFALYIKGGLSGPKGDAGAMGAPGVQGPAGPKGDAGNDANPTELNAIRARLYNVEHAVGIDQDGNEVV